MRYLIYEMIGKVVKFKLPQRMGGDKVRGVVEDVYRDVLRHEIEIIFRSKKYVFREPTEIMLSENNVLFVYGDIDTDTDDDFFDQLRNLSMKGYGADEVFKSMSKVSTVITFELTEPPKEKISRRDKTRKLLNENKKRATKKLRKMRRKFTANGDSCG